MSSDKQESRVPVEDERLDQVVEGTFPASDPPAHGPPPGSRKAERKREAERAVTPQQERKDDPIPH